MTGRRRKRLRGTSPHIRKCLRSDTRAFVRRSSIRCSRSLGSAPQEHASAGRVCCGCGGAVASAWRVPAECFRRWRCGRNNIFDLFGFAFWRLVLGPFDLAVGPRWDCSSASIREHASDQARLPNWVQNVVPNWCQIRPKHQRNSEPDMYQNMVGAEPECGPDFSTEKRS